MNNFVEFLKHQWQRVTVIVSSVILCIFTCIYITHNNIEHYKHYTSYQVYIETNKLVYDSIKLSLVEQVDQYISQVAHSSNLNGLVLVNNCLEYDIDICFVLAQAEQESHFGTQGVARKTNSVFNVFAFDGKNYNQINTNGKYAHPNDCVEPYMRLLKRDYLVNGKTEYDMLNEYVNKHGKRYASSENYEQALFNKVNKIKNNTSIDSTYQELLKQKLIIEM